MDEDPCGGANFYDEIASFLPQPGDYNLDDLEEILRVTDSHLDSSLDFSALGVPNGAARFEALQPLEANDYHINFATLPSPANTNKSSACTTPPYDSSQSQRSSSISSVDGREHFNPDELMNFFNDDDVKMEDYCGDAALINMQQRNTPSPTGSCSSSGGSSTSGVQSDVSSVASMRSDESANFVELHQSEVYSIDNGRTTAESTLFAAPPVPVAPVAAVAATTTTTTKMPSVPISLLPAATNKAAQFVLPVKTVPFAVKTAAEIAAPTTVKIEPKLAPKAVVTQTPLKLAGGTPPSSASKIASPGNGKPKTIYLSSNDFKALMQKMNSGGAATKGAKITGGLNGQMPKIIMKTPNGKVIAANKIVQPLANGNGVAKIMKSNGSGPLMMKQQQQQHHHHHHHHQQQRINVGARVSGGSSHSSSSSSSSSGSSPDLTIYKGIIDEKILKKQQRMIKNRESASMSRKKKKEYVVSLEARINNLEKENYTLKGENSSLRSQLVAFAQTCQCKHSNISEFILNSLNVNGCGEQQPAPKPRSLKQRMSAANVRKNVAVLFAMAFMVTLNVGNFQTFLNKNAIESSIESATAAAAAAAESEVASSGRHLLWVESESEFKEKQNRSKRINELEVPPLHFLRPVPARAQLPSGKPREPPPLATRNCTTDSDGGGEGVRGATSNQTENMRLVSDLQKWIDGNDYLNLSMHEKLDDELGSPIGFKLTPDYMEWDPLELPLQSASAPTAGKQKRKYFLERSQQVADNRKQTKLDSKHAESDEDVESAAGNSLELFKAKLSDEYVRLFKGIKRQDDTFYVLSFNMDHILLPASVYNKSARPKMSLMLPAGDPSLNGDIVLMQIDCEVVNTTEVKLKSDIIPEKLRPLKYRGANPNDVASNETHAQQQAARSHANVTRPAAAAPSAMEKPVAKYFMMGPKTRAAGTAVGGDGGGVSVALKKKPIILKLNGNDSNGVPNFVALNVKNSTLFAKMRETVEAENAP